MSAVGGAVPSPWSDVPPRGVSSRPRQRGCSRWSSHRAMVSETTPMALAKGHNAGWPLTNLHCWRSWTHSRPRRSTTASARPPRPSTRRWRPSSRLRSAPRLGLETVILDSKADRCRPDITGNCVAQHDARVTKTLVETGNPGDHGAGNRFSLRGAAMEFRLVEWRVVLVALALVLAAGCGGGGGGGGGGDSTTTSSSSSTTETTIETSTSDTTGGNSNTTTPRSTNEPSD